MVVVRWFGRWVGRLGVGALVLVAWTCTVHAQAGKDPAAEGPERVEQARLLFQEGLRHVETEAWREAADTFRRVLALRASDVVIYNLASALVQLDELGEAVDLLRPISDSASVPEVEAAARQLLFRIEPQVGYLSVRVEGETDGLALKVGARRIEEGWTRRTVPVRPGQVAVAIMRGDRTLARATVMVEADSATAMVTLDLEKRRETPVATPQEVAERAQPPTPAGPSAPEIAADSARKDEDGGSITGKWWFWTAGAGVAVGTAILVAVVAASGTPSPRYVEGDAGLVFGKVMP